MTPGAAEVRRFAAGLDALAQPGRKVGVAVSGGPDSLALLLLAVAARPGLVEAATVDHGLRRESAGEAATVAAVCETLSVPHMTLCAEWESPPESAIQARARAARYGLLDRWARERGLCAVLTAHHADDQAETLLMRLDRGAGLGGLAGTRVTRPIVDGSAVRLIRPVLGWRRDELADIVAAAGIDPVDDPSNRDPRHRRTTARRMLASGWPDAAAVAASADHLAEAEEALAFVTGKLFAERAAIAGGVAELRAAGLPRELQRRLMLRLFEALGEAPPRGPDLDRALATLAAGGRCTLGGLMLIGGGEWRAEPVPPRRT